MGLGAAVKWGIISTADINRKVNPGAHASEKVDLMAVASRDLRRAEEYAREWEIDRAYGSYEALLEDADVEALYISLPNTLHCEWSIRAVEAGKHVLCEKPLALSVDEVDAIQAAAHKQGRIMQEAFMYRHHKQTLEVQELVKNGSLGTLKLVRGSFSFVLSHEGDIRLDPAMGGGSIWDVGCYPISYARTVIGENPLEVFGWQVTGPTGIDETFVGQMLFSNNVIAQFDCSFALPFHSFMEIVGSEATLNVPSPFKPTANPKIYLTRDGKTEGFRIRGQELYLGEVEDMADAIQLGKEPRISLDDSRANVHAIASLLESARTGKPVSRR